MIDKKILLSLVLTVITIGLVTPLISPLWKQVLFITFALYTLPFLNLRNEFRSMVYGTDSWTINIKPVFLEEIKTLFSNEGLDDQELRIAIKYRLYLLVYFIMVLLLTI